MCYWLLFHVWDHHVYNDQAFSRSCLNCDSQSKLELSAMIDPPTKQHFYSANVIRTVWPAMTAPRITNYPRGCSRAGSGKSETTVKLDPSERRLVVVGLGALQSCVHRTSYIQLAICGDVSLQSCFLQGYV